MDIKESNRDYWKSAKILTDYWELGTPIQAVAEVHRMSNQQ